MRKPQARTNLPIVEEYAVLNVLVGFNNNCFKTSMY